MTAYGEYKDFEPMTSWSTLVFEFLTSAVLWGTLVTILVIRLRNALDPGWRRKFVSVGLAWVALHTGIAWYLLVLPTSGTIVESTTGQPISGVRVDNYWHTYPIGIFVTACSGRQARVTDAGGHFSFPFVPVTSLLMGTFYRSVMPKVEGRLKTARNSFIPYPLRGEIPIFAFDSKADGATQSFARGCDVLLGPSVKNGKLPGQRSALSFLFSEACVEKRAHTRTDRYLLELISESNLVRSPPSVRLQELYMQLLGGARGPCVGGGGRCVLAASEQEANSVCDQIAPQVGAPGELLVR
ncbi:hypothetical protein C7S18_02895 [Ahniella affigens]|uniref:Uncharacterized protein n=1 Tax=Ahniella affigens TaxID=2021234 RepID=A0A2P1PN00_9GAMM|nr:carboxypeptidase regulatory-like domain-containing protein [Ahniella affigens]AVP96202.1 hypothetical protein C7S18_02895 [Ahniella affigens]